MSESSRSDPKSANRQPYAFGHDYLKVPLRHGVAIDQLTLPVKIFYQDLSYLLDRATGGNMADFEARCLKPVSYSEAPLSVQITNPHDRVSRRSPQSRISGCHNCQIEGKLFYRCHDLVESIAAKNGV